MSEFPGTNLPYLEIPKSITGNGDISIPYKPFSPGEFYIGVADNGAQNEGNNFKNDWVSWLTPEQRARMAAGAAEKDWGQGKVYDLPPSAFDPNTYDFNRSPDHWNRYLEDCEIAKNLGMETIHTSIEWSRIQPEQNGPYDKEALDHYDKMLYAYRAYGMEPVIDLSHFVLPQWAEKLGGWESSKVVEAFGQYAEDMAKRFRDRVHYWATFNEPDTYTSMVYLPETVLPGVPIALMPKEMSWLNYPQGWHHYLKARKNMVTAHEEAYQAIKQAVPEAEVGFTVSQVYFENAPDLISRSLRWLMEAEANEYFAPRMAPNSDWIGMQYYMHMHVKGLDPSGGNAFKQRTDEGWEIYPEGTYHRLKWLSSEVAYKNGIPVLVSEGGPSDRRDRYRAQYIRDSVEWTIRAVNDGVDCRGFNYWCLVENFEWDRPWADYGIISVDYENDLQRSVKPSALVLGAIAKEIKSKRKPVVNSVETV